MQRDDGGRGLSDFDSYFGRWNRELQKNGRRWVHESPPSSNSDRSQPSRRGGKGDEAPPPSPFDEGDEGRGTDSAEGATTRISTLRLTLRWLLHSSQLKPSSRIGARCQETLLSGAYVLNGPRVSALNGFLSLCYRASPAALLAAMLLAFTVLALVYAALLSLEPAGCGPADDPRAYWRLLLLAFAHLAGGEPVAPPDAPAGCLVLSAAAQWTALILQVVVLAVATTRFLNPYAEIIFTPVLIVRRRDGVDYLLMRLSHSLGHLLTDVNIVARYIRPHVTREGEAHFKTEAVHFFMASTLVNPVVASHELRPDSALHAALERHRQGDTSVPGVVAVEVTARDAVLCCPVATGYLFMLKDDVEFGTVFADVLVRNPLEAMATGSRIVVDMEGMLQTQPCARSAAPRTAASAASAAAPPAEEEEEAR